MKKTTTARLMLCASMAIFGTLGLFTRNISLGSGELALYRAVMATAVLGLWLLGKKERVGFASVKKELPLLLASGAALGINWILLFEAYRYTTISVATLSYYFAPVIVTAVCPILFRERMTAKQIVCFVMSTIGLVLIIGVGDLSGGSPVGIAFGLGAAVFYAAVILLNKFICNVAGLHRTVLQFLTAILVLTPYVFFTGGSSLGSLSGTGWVNLLAVGLIHTALAYCLYFSALKDLPGQEAAILSYIDPLLAVAVSVLVLGEPMTPGQLLGGVLVLGFTLWNERE